VARTRILISFALFVACEGALGQVSIQLHPKSPARGQLIKVEVRNAGRTVTYCVDISTSITTDKGRLAAEHPFRIEEFEHGKWKLILTGSDVAGEEGVRISQNLGNGNEAYFKLKFEKAGRFRLVLPYEQTTEGIDCALTATAPRFTRSITFAVH
jgi:hypothetical protein